MLPAEYDFTDCKDRALRLGLVWNGDLEEQARVLFSYNNITQQQAVAITDYHSTLTAHVWDRRSYGFMGRVMLALYFLGLTRNPLKVA